MAHEVPNHAGQREAPRVWVIGADHWPRAYVRAELIERAYDAVGFVALRDAVVRLFAQRSSRPALIVVDLHEQRPDERLLGALFHEGIPLVALGGAAEWGDEVIGAGAWTARLRRPITIGAVADAVDRLLGARPA